MSRDQLTTQQKFQALTDQRDGYQLQAEEVTRERDRFQARVIYLEQIHADAHAECLKLQGQLVAVQQERDQMEARIRGTAEILRQESVRILNSLITPEKLREMLKGD
jgi:hypothetical protein